MGDSWYQDVPFGDGNSSGGEQDCAPRWEAMRLLQGSLWGKLALDLGAAEGYFSAELAERGAEVISVERDLGACRRFRHTMDRRGLAGQVRLWAGADAAEFLAASASGRYDICLSLNLVHHLPGPLWHLHQCHAALKRGGVLYFEAPREPGSGVRLRGRGGYVLGFDAYDGALRRLFGGVSVVHDWRNSVGNRRVMWGAIKC